jgi:disulfide bond formation protein DsbB
LDKIIVERQKELIIMKKLLIGLVSLGLVLGIGTSVYANTAGDGFQSFREMVPFMQQMHPDMSEEQLENMYNSCHGENGGMHGMMRGMMRSGSVD